MSKITVTGQLTLTGGQLTAKVTVGAPAPSAGKTLWAWGYGAYLGDGTVITKSSPVQIGALTDWASIGAGGQHSVAIKTDGTLWTWGTAGNGRLGNGTSSGNLSSPVQVGALTDWAECSSDIDANGFSFVTKTDGTLWGWGINNAGQLGLGDTANRSSPVQVGSLSNWSKIAIGSHTQAIKTDGTLWGWGVNNNGAIGDGTVANKSSPVQIGALSDWASIDAAPAHTLAVKTDGSLWSWGSNVLGRLGDGTVVGKSSPSQVGALTDWSKVSGADGSLAIKTDGSLWAWGNNASNGQLGLGNTTNYSSPVQVGFLTDWFSISQRDHTLAIKTDGGMWSWGRGLFGAQGQGDTITRSSPVQIGSLTDWAKVDGGAFHTLALKDV